MDVTSLTARGQTMGLKLSLWEARRKVSCSGHSSHLSQVKYLMGRGEKAGTTQDFY